MGWSPRSISARARLFAEFATGDAPHGTAISPDGSFLFVVNNLSNTMSEVRGRHACRADRADRRIRSASPTTPRPITCGSRATPARSWCSGTRQLAERTRGKVLQGKTTRGLHSGRRTQIPVRLRRMYSRLASRGQATSSNRSPVALVSAAWRAGWPWNVSCRLGHKCHALLMPRSSPSWLGDSGRLPTRGQAGLKSASSIISRFRERTDAR